MRRRIVVSSAALLLSGLAFGQAPAADAAAVRPALAAAPAAATPAADGEVRKIDKAQGKVTLRHGPIANLDMPGMTMVFKVADPKMLDSVKEGDKVKFTADKLNGAITVTTMEPAAK